MSQPAKRNNFLCDGWRRKKSGQSLEDDSAAMIDYSGGGGQLGAFGGVGSVGRVTGTGKDALAQLTELSALAQGHAALMQGGPIQGISKFVTFQRATAAPAAGIPYDSRSMSRDWAEVITDQMVKSLEKGGRGAERVHKGLANTQNLMDQGAFGEFEPPQMVQGHFGAEYLDKMQDAAIEAGAVLPSGQAIPVKTLAHMTREWAKNPDTQGFFWFGTDGSATLEADPAAANFDQASPEQHQALAMASARLMKSGDAYSPREYRFAHAAMNSWMNALDETHKAHVAEKMHEDYLKSMASGHASKVATAAPAKMGDLLTDPEAKLDIGRSMQEAAVALNENNPYEAGNQFSELMSKITSFFGRTGGKAADFVDPRARAAALASGLNSFAGDRAQLQERAAAQPMMQPVTAPAAAGGQRKYTPKYSRSRIGEEITPEAQFDMEVAAPSARVMAMAWKGLQAPGADGKMKSAYVLGDFSNILGEIVPDNQVVRIRSNIRTQARKDFTDWGLTIPAALEHVGAEIAVKPYYFDPENAGAMDDAQSVLFAPKRLDAAAAIGDDYGDEAPSCRPRRNRRHKKGGRGYAHGHRKGKYGGGEERGMSRWGRGRGAESRARFSEYDEAGSRYGFDMEDVVADVDHMGYMLMVKAPNGVQATNPHTGEDVHLPQYSKLYSGAMFLNHDDGSYDHWNFRTIDAGDVSTDLPIGEVLQFQDVARPDNHGLILRSEVGSPHPHIGNAIVRSGAAMIIFE